LKIDLYCP